MSKRLSAVQMWWDHLQLNVIYCFQFADNDVMPQRVARDAKLPHGLFYFFYFILLASPTGRDTATACANYCGPGTRSQFCGGRKPEYPEETLEVRLRLIETQSTYNIVVEVEGVIDVHCASLTSSVKEHCFLTKIPRTAGYLRWIPCKFVLTLIL